MVNLAIGDMKKMVGIGDRATQVSERTVRTTGIGTKNCKYQD